MLAMQRKGFFRKLESRLAFQCYSNTKPETGIVSSKTENFYAKFKKSKSNPTFQRDPNRRPEPEFPRLLECQKSAAKNSGNLQSEFQCGLIGYGWTQVFQAHKIHKLDKNDSKTFHPLHHKKLTHHILPVIQNANTISGFINV